MRKTNLAYARPARAIADRLGALYVPPGSGRKQVATSEQKQDFEFDREILDTANCLMANALPKTKKKMAGES